VNGKRSKGSTARSGRAEDRLLTESELDAIRVEVAMRHDIGSLVPGTGGLRKFRWGAKGRGKRGGVRIIYYYGGDTMPLFLIALYAKNEKSDMTQAEKSAATKLVEALKSEYARRPTTRK
jgi:hypothetical protein